MISNTRKSAPGLLYQRLKVKTAHRMAANHMNRLSRVIKSHSNAALSTNDARAAALQYHEEDI